VTPLRERIRIAATAYLTGWRYGREVRVAYPWPHGVRGPPVATTPDEQAIDCSTLTASLLMRVYPDAGWTQADYADLQVFDAPRYSSPVGAVVRRGVGEAVAAPVAEAWHLVQAWRSIDPPSGHAFVAYDRGNGKLDVLESSSRGLVGPRWRTVTLAELRREFPAALFLARLAEGVEWQRGG